MAGGGRNPEGKDHRLPCSWTCCEDWVSGASLQARGALRTNSASGSVRGGDAPSDPPLRVGLPAQLCGVWAADTLQPLAPSRSMPAAAKSYLARGQAFV